MTVLLALLHLHFYHLIVAGPRHGLLAVTDTGEQTVTLYTYPGEPRALERKVLGYEVGHVLDVSCLTDSQRSYWQHLRHLQGTWYAPDYTDERGYGSGDFADAVSAWETHSWRYFRERPLSTHDLRTLAHRFHFARGVC